MEMLQTLDSKDYLPLDLEFKLCSLESPRNPLRSAPSLATAPPSTGKHKENERNENRREMEENGNCLRRFGGKMREI